MYIRAGHFSPIKEKSLFPAWTRPDSYWDAVVAHLPIALITGLGLLLPHLVTCDILPLKKCTFLYLTGFPCPFCGFTRSFWAISGGAWHFAARNCPLSLGVYGLMAALFAWHSTALLFGIRMKSGFYPLCKSVYTWWILGGLFFINWVYRISFGLT